MLFGDLPGLIAAVLLGLSPLYFTFSTDLWSDIPATACILVVMALYVSSVSLDSQHGILKAASAGLLLGYAVFIRYSAAIFILPLAFYALVVARASDGNKRRLAVFLATFGFAMLGVLVFNRVYYGDFLAAAYSPRAGWYPWPAFFLAHVLGPSPVGGRSS